MKDKALMGAVERVGREILAERGKWLERTLEKLLPPDIFKLGYTKKGSDRFRVSRWMNANKIEMCEEKDCMVVKKDGKVFSEFRVSMIEGKVQALSRDLTDGVDTLLASDSVQNPQEPLPPSATSGDKSSSP